MNCLLLVAGFSTVSFNVGFNPSGRHIKEEKKMVRGSVLTASPPLFWKDTPETSIIPYPLPMVVRMIIDKK